MTDQARSHAESLRHYFSLLSNLDWRKLTRWSIKASEVRLLLVIREFNLKEGGAKATVSDLRKILNVTSPTVTQMVNHLMQNDYVTRTVRSDDRRITEIALTSRGEQVAGEASEISAAFFEGLVDYLGEEQCEQLIRGLEKCIAYGKQVKSSSANRSAEPT